MTCMHASALTRCLLCCRAGWRHPGGVLRRSRANKNMRHHFQHLQVLRAQNLRVWDVQGMSLLRVASRCAAAWFACRLSRIGAVAWWSMWVHFDVHSAPACAGPPSSHATSLWPFLPVQCEALGPCDDGGTCTCPSFTYCVCTNGMKTCGSTRVCRVRLCTHAVQNAAAECGCWRMLQRLRHRISNIARTPRPPPCTCLTLRRPRIATSLLTPAPPTPPPHAPPCACACAPCSRPAHPARTVGVEQRACAPAQHATATRMMGPASPTAPRAGRAAQTACALHPRPSATSLGM